MKNFLVTTKRIKSSIYITIFKAIAAVLIITVYTAQKSVAQELHDKNAVYFNELVSFTSENSGSFVKLQWETANEANNDHFTVERSADGKVFEEIMAVKGAGFSNSNKKYSVYDRSPLSGRAYYRLKQTALGGQNTSFNVTVLNSGNVKPAISLQQEVYPNPFNDAFQVCFNLDYAGSVILSLTDIQGKLLKTKIISATKGFNQISFSDANKLMNGLYFVFLEYDGQVVSCKVSKTDS